MNVNDNEKVSSQHFLSSKKKYHKEEEKWMNNKRGSSLIASGNRLFIISFLEEKREISISCPFLFFSRLSNAFNSCFLLPTKILTKVIENTVF